MRVNGLFAMFLVVALGIVTPAQAQVEMPDLRQMSGVPLPASELPDQSVSVRVVRGALSNNVANQTVELRAGDKTLTSRTDDTGRAQFKDIPAGLQVTVSTTLDGERLASSPFTLPMRGGVRMMLVGGAPSDGIPGLPAKQAAPRPGIVVLGPQSRFVIEMGDASLRVFGLLEIRNTATYPVTTSGSLVFNMPAGAQGTTVLEGSASQAKAEGPRVTVTGPFAPGVTLAQFAYELPYSGGDVQITHNVPAALNQLSVVVEQPLDDMRLVSPQLSTHGHESIEGRRYIVAGGGGLPAGGSFTLSLSGLPHHSQVPRYVALALAGLILVGGVIAAFAGRGSASPDAKRLAARRDALFVELVKLEENRQASRIAESKYAARRRDLIVQLERIYAALDDDGMARETEATDRVRRSA